MSLASGLKAGRGSILFLIGLGLSMAFALKVEDWDPRTRAAAARAESAEAVEATPAVADETTAVPLPLAPRQPLTDDDRAAARTAWAYFAANTISGTGLVGSVQGFDGASLWDLGSQLYAIVSAEIAEVIPRAEAVRRTRAALRSLAALPLTPDGTLNKSYDVRMLAVVDYNNAPAPAGIGWSGTDVARFLGAVRLMALRYPELAAEAHTVIARAGRVPVVSDGHVRGAAAGGAQQYSEARFGYEQYAARVMATVGTVDVQAIAVDEPIAAPVVSEPFILAGLELGWDAEFQRLASAVYRAQEARAASSGVLTASSEDHMDRDPRFAYTTVGLNGAPWAAETGEGVDATAWRSISTKAAFGWSALFATEYTARLRREAGLWRSEGGFYAGRYEQSGETNAVLSTNTNAVILESLAYRVAGPLARAF